MNRERFEDLDLSRHGIIFGKKKKKTMEDQNQ